MSLAARFSRQGLDWIVPSWDAPATVRAFVTTRRGGPRREAPGAPAYDAPGAHADFDLGPSHLDRVDEAARDTIVECRRRVAAFLPAAPLWLEQVHGRDVVTVDAGSLGRASGAPPVADAAVTREPDLPLAIRVADCLPVLFAARDGSVVGAAHAGWRGLAAGVLEATVAAMDVPPAEIVAWIGPGIGPHAFEVGGDVRDAFVAQDRDAAAHFVPRDAAKWLADLPALARRHLAACGVARVDASGLCTYSDALRFHSFRRDRTSARLGAFLWRAGA